MTAVPYDFNSSLIVSHKGFAKEYSCMIYLFAGDVEYVHYDIIQKFWEHNILCVRKQMAEDVGVFSSRLGVSTVLAGGNELGLVESDAERETVLGRQSKNVHSRCPICNRWLLVNRLGLFRVCGPVLRCQGSQCQGSRSCPVYQSPSAQSPSNLNHADFSSSQFVISTSCISRVCRVEMELCIGKW